MKNFFFYIMTVLIWGSTWIGIILVFMPEVTSFSLNSDNMHDILLCMLATLRFPLVALAISTVWENYQWTGSARFGVGLILCGNLLMIQRKKFGKLTSQVNQMNTASKFAISGDNS